MQSSQFTPIVEPVLNRVFDGNYGRNDSQWDKLFVVKKADKHRFQEDVNLYGFGLFPEKEEGGAFVEDQGGVAYYTRYQHRVFALGFSLTEEMIEDSSSIKFGAVYAEHLANSAEETKEITHANLFNNAFSNVQLGGDGSPLVSPTHRLHGFGPGVFASNTLPTDADLSEASLEQARAQIMVMPDERGKQARLRIQRLIVSPLNRGNADRICKSDKQSDSNSNNVNVIRQWGMFPKGVFELTRLTNDKAWFIKNDRPNGLTHYYKRKMKRGMETDFGTGSMRYKASERYSLGWSDWRDIFGSQGG